MQQVRERLKMATLTLDEVRSKVREGSRVLWVYRGYVEDGDVIIKSGDRLDLCWLEGHSSRNDTILVSDVLAIFDGRGKSVQVFPFTGKGFMTEAGDRWVAEHPHEAF
jgi:hypothetical protein